MEILTGILFGTLSFIIIYWDLIEKEKKVEQFVKLLRSMDEKTEDRIWAKVDRLEGAINEIKISIATMKVKIAYISGAFSFAGALVFTIVKEFVFK